MDIADLLAPLQRGPDLLAAALLGVPVEWSRYRAGLEHWTPLEAAAHMAALEETAWVPRVRHFLERGDAEPLPAVDPQSFRERFADGDEETVVEAFARAREANLAELASFDLAEDDLGRAGVHGALGAVRLGQLLSAWVAHDLNHVGQIHEAMAARLRQAVGPWESFLPIVSRL